MVVLEEFQMLSSCTVCEAIKELKLNKATNCMRENDELPIRNRESYSISNIKSVKYKNTLILIDAIRFGRITPEYKETGG